MESRQIRAAIIGLGVGERHIRGYESDSRCRVTVLCDINPEKLAQVGERHPGKRLTTDADEVLSDPEIDVVSIATYDDMHAAQTISAIQAGKHVFVEKPLCLLDAEFDAIETALRARPDVFLSTNFVLRRAPQFQELKRRVQAGALGRLYHIEGAYNYGRLHKITQEWRGERPFYSVTHGGAIHLIDLMLWLARSPIVEVTALGNKIATEGTRFRFPDMVSALLKFENGMTASVAANFGCVCPHHYTLSAFGTEGSFVHGQQGALFFASRDPQEKPEQISAVYAKEAKVDVQRSFIHRILDGAEADVQPEEVMNAMAVSLAIERSLHSGRWETVRYARIGARPADTI